MDKGCWLCSRANPDFTITIPFDVARTTSSFPFHEECAAHWIRTYTKDGAGSWISPEFMAQFIGAIMLNLAYRRYKRDT